MGGEMTFELIVGTQKAERGISIDLSEQGKPPCKRALEWGNSEKKSDVLKKKPRESRDMEAAGLAESELRSNKMG